MFGTYRAVSETLQGEARATPRCITSRDLIVIQAEATIGNTTEGSGIAADLNREQVEARQR